MPDRKIVGERMRKLRGTRTLAEVGKALNVTSMAISLWENGERIPNDDMKVKIAAYYNTTVTDIFFSQEVNETIT